MPSYTEYYDPLWRKELQDIYIESNPELFSAYISSEEAVSVFNLIWEHALQGKPPESGFMEDYWSLLFLLAKYQKLIDKELAEKASFERLIGICEELIKKEPPEISARNKNIIRKKIKTSCFNRTILVEVLERMGYRCVIKGEDIYLSTAVRFK